MTEVHELLRTGAGESEPLTFTGADVRRRVDRRARDRRRTRVAGAACAAIVLFGGAWAGGLLSGSDDQHVASGSISPEAQELSGRWILTAFVLVSAGSNEPTWLDLGADGRMTGGVDCTGFEARWDVADGHLLVDELRSQERDMTGCVPAGTEPDQAEVLLGLLEQDPFIVQPGFSTGDGLVLSEQGVEELDAGGEGTWFAFSRFEDMGPVPSEAEVVGPWSHVDGTVVFDGDGSVSLDACPDGHWRYRDGRIQPADDPGGCDAGLAAILDAGAAVRTGGEASERLYLSSDASTMTLVPYAPSAEGDPPTSSPDGPPTAEVVATPPTLRLGEQLLITSDSDCVGDLTIQASGPNGFAYSDPNQTSGSVLFSFSPTDFDALGTYEVSVICTAGVDLRWFGTVVVTIEGGPPRPEYQQGAPDHPCFLPDGMSVDCD
jgi:hypothetical protein